MKSINPCGITKIGDPFVLRASDGKYYMYATTHELDMLAFKVWTSTDFTNWDEGVECYRLSPNSFGFCDCWAPEVVEYNGKYIMHYTARWKKNHSLRIGVAVSDSPLGPFKDVYDRPMFDPEYASIDGNVFIDDDGQKYMYFSRDCCDNVFKGEHQSHIYVIRLSDDLLSTVGEPVFLFGPTKEYENHAHMGSEGTFKWNEGPFMLKIGDEYHIMFSANFFSTKYYAICGAKSKSPLGPFEKYDAPIATFIEGKVSGPGHNSVFKDENGQLYCAYHVHTDINRPGQDRQLFIDKLDFVDGKLTMKITFNE